MNRNPPLRILAMLLLYRQYSITTYVTKHFLHKDTLRREITRAYSEHCFRVTTFYLPPWAHGDIAHRASMPDQSKLGLGSRLGNSPFDPWLRRMSTSDVHTSIALWARSSGESWLIKALPDLQAVLKNTSYSFGWACNLHGAVRCCDLDTALLAASRVRVNACRPCKTLPAKGNHPEKASATLNARIRQNANKCSDIEEPQSCNSHSFRSSHTL